MEYTPRSKESEMPTFSGIFLWHTMNPWPQRPGGLVDLGFQEFEVCLSMFQPGLAMISQVEHKMLR